MGKEKNMKKQKKIGAVIIILAIIASWILRSGVIEMIMVPIGLLLLMSNKSCWIEIKR